MADLGELLVKVKSEGAGDAAEEVQDAAQEGTEAGGDGLLSGLVGEGLGAVSEGLGGSGGGITSILGSMSGLMAGVLGGIGAILGVLLTMEPIQKMLSSFMKIIQAFFLPLAKAVIKVIAPVMKAMMKLLPKWLSFWSDPVGNIKKALKFIWDALKSIVPNLISGLFSLPGMIWDKMKQLGGIIKEKLSPLIDTFISALNLIPGVNIGDGGQRRGEVPSGGSVGTITEAERNISLQRLRESIGSSEWLRIQRQASREDQGMRKSIELYLDDDLSQIINTNAQNSDISNIKGVGL